MNQTILAIDDEPDVLDMVRAVLNTKGHHIHTAVGGEEGLKQAEALEPALIICDLMMPRISGLEVIKRLRKNQKLRRIPIIVMSALGDDTERPPEFWVKSLGVDDYIRKPFDPLDLLGRVEFILRRRSYVSMKSQTDISSDPTPVPERGGIADQETSFPVSIKNATPGEVVKAFIESYNRQDFATEYLCLSEEMRGDIGQHDYTSRRRQTFLEEKGLGRTQRLIGIIEEKISLNVSKVVVDREDRIGGVPKTRRETYTLKKTHLGWKIINCRSARLDSSSSENIPR